MIKRPFLWGNGAFIGGILLAWHKIPLPFLMIPACLGWLLTYLLIFHFKRFINRKDIFLFGLPFLMLLGFLAMTDQMKPPDMDKAFDDKASCILTGQISMIVKRPKGYAYYLKDNLVTLSEDNTYPVEEIIVYADDREEYLVGNKITVRGKIYKFSENTNPGGFNEHLYYKIQNIDYKVYSENIILTDSDYSKFHYLINYIKNRFINTFRQIFGEKEAGIMIAMILGEKHLLEDEIKSLYQENGISHILAISGLHISMVGTAIYFFLRKLKLGLYVSTLMSLIFVYSYGILTNFSVSTKRAVVMYSVMLFANLIGKTFDLLSALSLSAFIILLRNPMQIFHAGFILSFGAVLGIALLLPCFNNLYKAKSQLVQGIYVSVSVQVFTLPFIIYYFFQIPVYSVLINIIVVPLTSLLILSTLIAGILSFISFPLGIFLAGGANYILLFYERICRLGIKLPASLITIGRPDIIRIILYFILIFIFIGGARKYRKKNHLFILVVALGILIIPRTRDGLRITMLDVGQGDAIYMETEKGTTFLIDGGSSDIGEVGSYRIKPYLLSIGVDHIDYAIVTHADMDHISGLMELIRDSKITIYNLVLPKIDRSGDKVKEFNMKDTDNYRDLQVLAETYGLNIMYIKAGDYIREGMLDISCLHPYEGYQSSSENEYSTVLSVSYGKFDMLLTGDLEADGEDIIISKLSENLLEGKGYLPSSYDVLKVAHHGSKHSTSDKFIQAVKPKYALISCGRNNRYGHPHEEVLDRLNRVESRVEITYETGAITIRTDGERMQVERYLERNKWDSEQLISEFLIVK